MLIYPGEGGDEQGGNREVMTFIRGNLKKLFLIEKKNLREGGQDGGKKQGKPGGWLPVVTRGS